MSDNGNIWADKFIKRELIPAGELAQRFNINNPRQHPEAQRAATESSLDTVGWIDEVSLSTNGDGPPSLADNSDAVMFDGHERVEIALVRGGPDTLVPVNWYQLTPEETDFALLAKDQTSAMAQIDPVKMADLMERTKAMTTAPGLQGMLERLKEQVADGLLAQNGNGAGTDTPPAIDKAPKLQEKWQVKPGDIWEIGDHKIICADCRETETWRLLLNGQKVNGVFTSPPYAEQRKAQYGGVPADKYIEWWEAVQENVRVNLADDGSFFVNIKPHCEDGQRVLYVFDLVIAMVRQWGWQFVDELCWPRPGVPGTWPNRFKNGFEPIYQFCINNKIKFNPQNVTHHSAHAWRGRGGSPMIAYDGHNVHLETFEGEAWPSNLLQIKDTPGAETLGHEAPFSISLPTFFIKAYSDSGDLWIDPFVGSGTTIVAAHNENRIGYGIERLEKYCAVILERMQQHTGIQPRLLETVEA